MSHRLLVAAAVGASVLLVLGAAAALLYRLTRPDANDGHRGSRRLIFAAALGASVLFALGAAAVDYRLNRPSAIEGDREAIEKHIADPAVLPSGYRERVVASGLTAPTDFGFLPDGRPARGREGGGPETGRPEGRGVEGGTRSDR